MDQHERTISNERCLSTAKGGKSQSYRRRSKTYVHQDLFGAQSYKLEQSGRDREKSGVSRTNGSSSHSGGGSSGGNGGGSTGGNRNGGSRASREHLLLSPLRQTNVLMTTDSNAFPPAETIPAGTIKYEDDETGGILADSGFDRAFSYVPGLRWSQSSSRHSSGGEATAAGVLGRHGCRRCGCHQHSRRRCHRWNHLQSGKTSRWSWTLHISPCHSDLHLHSYSPVGLTKQPTYTMTERTVATTRACSAPIAEHE